jgi:hypothetical protein
MQNRITLKKNNLNNSEKFDRLKSFVVSISIFIFLYFTLIFLKIVTSSPEPIEDIIEIEKSPEEITIHKFETSEKSGGGSGTEVKAPVQDKFTPQTEKIVTDPNSESSATNAKGNSNHSNSEHNTENESSTTKAAPNPFGTGGSGGGSGGGNGKGFGKDDGNGSGKGNGDGVKARIRLNDPNTEGIESDQNCKIYLKLTINAEGDIIKGENIVSKTSTTNQIIINQIIANVKSQVKYNKREGSDHEIVFLTVNLAAK